MTNDVKKHLILNNSSISDAIKRLNEINPQILFVVNKSSKLLGSVTDGDVRRYILKSEPLNKNIKYAINKNPVTCNIRKKKLELNYYKNLLVKRNLKAIPVTKNKKIVDIIFPQIIRKQSTPVIIMAGGKGSRLLPLTTNTPKPLIKIHSKPMLQHLIENIKNEDFQNIFISINHFGLQIKKFINSIKFKDIEIKFIEEKTPLDTAGCLSFFKNKIDKNLIVINADVMTDLKLEKILNYHLDTKSDLTIGCLIHQYQIPFGVIKLKKNKYNAIEEKPIIKKLVNCGIYVLSKNVIMLTKKNERLSMLDLIERAKLKNKKIALFPMHENWIDVGNKVNLQKARDWLTEK